MTPLKIDEAGPKVSASERYKTQAPIINDDRGFFVGVVDLAVVEY